jgi:hypothetical protein
MIDYVKVENMFLNEDRFYEYHFHFIINVLSVT